MSSNTIVDNCECEANLFFKKYRSKIEAVLQNEKDSLKNVIDKTGDYGTFKESGKETPEGSTKSKTSILDSQMDKSKESDKRKITDLGGKSKDAVVKEKLSATEHDAKSKATELDAKSKATELETQSTQAGDKDAVEHSGKPPTKRLKKGKLRDTAKKEGKASDIEGNVLDALMERSEQRLAMKKMGRDKASYILDNSKVPREGTEPGEERKLQLVPYELKDKDKREFYESGKYREVYDEAQRMKGEGNKMGKLPRRKPRSTALEKEEKILKIIHRGKDGESCSEEIEKEGLKGADEQEDYKSQMNETLLYLCDTKTGGGEEMERDYITIISKFSRSSAEADDCFLFKQPILHAPDAIVSDSQKQVEDYLKSHKIYQFLHFLMSHLVAANSRNPIYYLITLLDKCLKYRANYCGPPLLFQKQHVESLFTSMDPMETGFIENHQYHTGMKTLGIIVYNKRPSMNRNNMISKQQFVEEALKQLTYQLDEMIKTTEHPSITTFVSYESGFTTPYG